MVGKTEIILQCRDRLERALKVVRLSGWNCPDGAHPDQICEMPESEDRRTVPEALAKGALMAW